VVLELEVEWNGKLEAAGKQLLMGDARSFFAAAAAAVADNRHRHVHSHTRHNSSAIHSSFIKITYFYCQPTQQLQRWGEGERRGKVNRLARVDPSIYPSVVRLARCPSLDRVSVPGSIIFETKNSLEMSSFSFDPIIRK
jgi:hypothetical protein